MAPGGGVDGNSIISSTPRRCPSRFHWFATINGYKNNEAPWLQWIQVLLDDPNCKFLAIQEEIGDSGNEHLQAQVSFFDKLRLTETYPQCRNAHWEKTKHLGNALEYCTRESKRAPNGRFWKKGEQGWPRPLVKKVVAILQRYEISELTGWQVGMFDLVKEPAERDCRLVYWLWESKGRFGKSQFCKILVDNLPCIVLSGKCTDAIHGMAKSIEEKGIWPQVVVWDCPRTMKDHVAFQAIESLKNGCCFSPKYEGGMLRFNTPHVIVLANQPPRLEEFSADRWIVKSLRGESPPAEGRPGVSSQFTWAGAE